VKAFGVERYGSEAGARMREVPEPDAGEHDVPVEVRAASVNPLDATIRDASKRTRRAVSCAGGVSVVR
jgi:NADPH:quinone reductase-like Zn-dependent oxidoreductase